MSQYKSPKHFNPFTIVIKLMQATNNKTKPLFFFSHAISLSTKHLLAKNNHQINEPHITQTASIFCHNKNQFQILSLVGTYSNNYMNTLPTPTHARTHTHTHHELISNIFKIQYICIYKCKNKCT